MYRHYQESIVFYNHRKYWQNCRKTVTQNYRACSELDGSQLQLYILPFKQLDYFGYFLF